MVFEAKVDDSNAGILGWFHVTSQHIAGDTTSGVSDVAIDGSTPELTQAQTCCCRIIN